MAVYHTNSKDFISPLNKLLASSKSVLDIGSGLGVLLDKYKADYIVALDIYRPFLENRVYDSPHIIPINADAHDIDRLFLSKTFGAVTFIDSIEHFTKADGLAILKKAEQLAWDKVVAFTPRGFFPQSVDHYNLKGDKYQTHYSGWEPGDFMSLGYDVLVMRGFHDAQNRAFVESFGIGHPPVDALLAWKTMK